MTPHYFTDTPIYPRYSPPPPPLCRFTTLWLAGPADLGINFIDAISCRTLIHPHASTVNSTPSNAPSSCPLPKLGSRRRSWRRRLLLPPPPPRRTRRRQRGALPPHRPSIQRRAALGISRCSVSLLNRRSLVPDLRLSPDRSHVHDAPPALTPIGRFTDLRSIRLALPPLLGLERGWRRYYPRARAGTRRTPACASKADRLAHRAGRRRAVG